jgi:hypothetical protein
VVVYGKRAKVTFANVEYCDVAESHFAGSDQYSSSLGHVHDPISSARGSAFAKERLALISPELSTAALWTGMNHVTGVKDRKKDRKDSYVDYSQ